MTTQKKSAGRPAKKKTAAQDPATDPINNPSSEIDNDIDNDGSEDEEDDFDASVGEGPGASDSDENKPPTPQEKPAAAAKATTQKKSAGKTDPGNFEEWRVEIKGGEYEKVKKLRDNVKISEFEAETLNQGALGQNNASYHVMYFRPE